MDLGVGSFVFSLGIVSSGPLIPSLHSARHRFRPPRALLLNNIKKALPLLALGLVRVVMVKGMDYPEHASEYGVHWNFFLTLAVLPVLSSLCRPLTRLARYSVIGLSIGAGYQVLLWWRADLQEWILSDPRVRHGGFVQQNKEGLASLAGYLAIFMLGIDLGHYVLPLDPYQAFRRRSRTRRREKTGKLSMVLASFSVLYWSAFLLLRLLGAQNSRRLANLVYVVWVTAFNASFLLCYVAVYAKWLQLLKQRALASAASVQELEVRQWTKRMAEWSPSLLEDINRHSFAIFLAVSPGVC
ncbi:hypothetical protein K437DRAFT_255340 [Tilletiaria anomala UBC 951]|uniref:GPI-anchored wall transfer protein 1 n=1 Tax=Tilletiaria anomala (strain ATCC 24038 / CBS 436.72 / UBC 951) TaxID=1037660 RepID=A0A066W5G4_TILAU|nr:uncharacterized protein K437DRAFT_255340 [Tilletiaria anomala UBC 951]KDN49212.1 hypothetical protein K437DRAFT_255340 [Tilletiaria anomala UBC 951]